jgi:apolipoprotein N-acyltransferase
MGRREMLLSLTSGILVALSFPLPGLSFLVWVALVPLLMAADGKDFRYTFKLGFLAGVVAFGGILYWINIVVVTYGHLPWLVSLFVYGLLVAYLALYPAVVTALSRWVEDAGHSLVLILPLLWVAGDLVRSFLLSGFPWANLGHSQYRILPLIQVADLTGVYGITFLIIFANVVIFRMVRALFARCPEHFPGRAAGLLILLLFLTLLYGVWRLNGQEGGRTLRVALIQGNIDQGSKWEETRQDETVAIYDRLSRQACANGADLVVWPESAVPFFFQEDSPLSEQVRAVARTTRSCLVTGSPAYERDTNQLRFFNSAFLISPTGELLGRSDKIHLVPFGEYVPLGPLLPFVHKLVEGIGEFTPGERPLPLNTGNGQIGVLVCFEGIFPDLAREYVREGGRLLVNITNDAWFGRSSAPYQHLSIIVFRAVENRVPVVRAANTGITAVIDSRGHIRGMTPIFEEAILTREVRFGDTTSFYTRFGDLFAWVALLWAAALLYDVRRRKLPR